MLNFTTALKATTLFIRRHVFTSCDLQVVIKHLILAWSASAARPRDTRSLLLAAVSGQVWQRPLSPPLPHHLSHLSHTSPPAPPHVGCVTPVGCHLWLGFTPITVSPGCSGGSDGRPRAAAFQASNHCLQREGSWFPRRLTALHHAESSGGVALPEARGGGWVALVHESLFVLD